MSQNEEVKLLNLIKTRRAVRSYKDKAVSDQDLKHILEAGHWAPTPSNVQSWRFCVVKNTGLVTIMKNISPGFPESAPIGIAVCSDQEDLRNFRGSLLDFLSVAESAVAAQNMILSAWAKGIATCPVASFSRSGVKELLSLPKHISPMLLVAIGYPESVPDAPERKDLKQITFWDGYGRKNE